MVAKTAAAELTPRKKKGMEQHLLDSRGSPSGKNGGARSTKKSPKDEPDKRVSSRIQNKQREEKELLVRRRVELLGSEDVDEENVSSMSPVASGRKKRNVQKTAEKKINEEVLEKNKSPEKKEMAGEKKDPNLCEKSAHAKVKETLRLFNKHYLHFVQEEELRCPPKVKEVMKPAVKKTSKKSKGNDKPEKDDKQKNKAKRPDLKAISKMLETNTVLYPEKRIGDLPGINVGHQFYSRAEMVAVGFHSHWLNGIDYIGQSYSKGEYKEYTLPLAVAIVISGMYEDDLDNAEDVIYTGQGGHNLTGDKRQNKDQVLLRGNLALKNCAEQSVPVRVVRGHICNSSYCGKVYTYDGLYKVVNYWAEKGLSGFTVYKYRLKRHEGQPLLTTNQVQFAHGQVPKSIAEIRGLVCEDITGGQEHVPIPATNLVDDPPVAPEGYTYCKSIQFGRDVKIPPVAPGCNCEGSCSDPRTCACAKLNGSEFPYVHRDGGRLIEAKNVVYECGPKCGCGPGCVNRTSQKGLRYRLEVFKTPKKGWAVRSWDFIPSGAPICEYIGALLRTEDLENIIENNYIFDIDCVQTMKGLDGRERRQKDTTMPATESLEALEDHKSENIPEFCIDAGTSGNIARFINHSCEPNLFVQCVLSSHHDMKLARVMLFAADNIPPLQELTYDYGYALDSVQGPDGKLKKLYCYCGAADCRKRLL